MLILKICKSWSCADNFFEIIIGKIYLSKKFWWKTEHFSDFHSMKQEWDELLKVRMQLLKDPLKLKVDVAPTSFFKFLWVSSIDLKKFGVKRSTFGVFEVMAILDVFFDYFRRFFLIVFRRFFFASREITYLFIIWDITIFTEDQSCSYTCVVTSS